MAEGLPTCERDGPVATVRFNRPDRLNAFDPDVIVELVSQLERLAGDTEIRAVILTGTGRGFCAGGDLRGLRDKQPTTRTEDERVATMLRLTNASTLLHEMPKLTIAAVNGPCAGAGFSLACAADVRIAAASAVFATAFATAGQTGDYGGTWFLPRLVGAGKARELLLLGGIALRRCARSSRSARRSSRAADYNGCFGTALRGYTHRFVPDNRGRGNAHTDRRGCRGD